MGSLPAGGHVTMALLGANIAMFIMQWLVPELTMAGAKVAPAIFQQGQFYRLLTPIFLHGSVSHLLMNCLSLYNIGPAVESYFGSSRMLLVYVLSGVAGNVASCLYSPQTVGIGASGAVFGMMGAFGMFLYSNQRVLGGGSRRALGSIGRVVLINAAFGLSTRGIDNLAHAGGFVGGALMAALVGPRLRMVWSPLAGRAVLQDRPPLSLAAVRRGWRRLASGDDDRRQL
ncbi:unnamed protein product [Phaeothamnion confervicola]